MNYMIRNAALKPFVCGTFRFLARSVVGLTFTVAVHAPVFAANFSVVPTSMELSGKVKSGAFSIINSGEEQFSCQIEVKEWSQDSEGKDVYSEARDIVFFPKIMTIDPNGQRAIRIGIKGPPSLQEKTYRLFTEEIPGQKKVTEEKLTEKIVAGLTIAFRYAVPIFVKPVRPEESAVIEHTNMAMGIAKTMVKNTGNVHVRLRSVTFQGKALDGKELFSQEVAGWYILQGQSRPYEVIVPAEVCEDLASIDISAQAENMTIKGILNVQREMCEQ